jgi:hypothetical protein
MPVVSFVLAKAADGSTDEIDVPRPLELPTLAK